VDIDDPYELHARRFLARLQRLSEKVRKTDEDMDGLISELNRCWPQILKAFWWTNSEKKHRAYVAELCDAFGACAGGDANIEYRRSAADLRRWSNAARDYAKRLCDNPNDAAFLYRFAGIALTESGIVEIARNTRTQIADVFAVAKRHLETLPSATGSVFEEPMTASAKDLNDTKKQD
jgi:hypothetical protein